VVWEWKHAGQRLVYTIGISPAVCGDDTNMWEHSIQAVITGKESIIQVMSHGKQEGDQRDQREFGSRVGGIGESGDHQNEEGKGGKRRYYCNNIPGHAERVFCSFCKKTAGDDILETEQQLWLSCEHNGQRQTWDTTTNIWRKTTPRNWPAISLGLIRGSAVITFNNDCNSDSERLWILISMTIWAICKSRNKNTINNQDVGVNSKIHSQ